MARDPYVTADLVYFHKAISDCDRFREFVMRCPLRQNTLEPVVTQIIHLFDPNPLRIPGASPSKDVPHPEFWYAMQGLGTFTVLILRYLDRNGGGDQELVDRDRGFRAISSAIIKSWCIIWRWVDCGTRRVGLDQDKHPLPDEQFDFLVGCIADFVNLLFLHTGSRGLRELLFSKGFNTFIDLWYIQIQHPSLDSTETAFIILSKYIIWMPRTNATLYWAQMVERTGCTAEELSRLTLLRFLRLPQHQNIAHANIQRAVPQLSFMVNMLDAPSARTSLAALDSTYFMTRILVHLSYIMYKDPEFRKDPYRKVVRETICVYFTDAFALTMGITWLRRSLEAGLQKHVPVLRALVNTMRSVDVGRIERIAVKQGPFWDQWVALKQLVDQRLTLAGTLMTAKCNYAKQQPTARPADSIVAADVRLKDKELRDHKSAHPGKHLHLMIDYTQVPPKTTHAYVTEGAKGLVRCTATTMPGPLRSLPPPNKKRKVQEDSKTSKSIQKLETELSHAVSTNSSLNPLADLLDLALATEHASETSKAIYALYRIFVLILSADKMGLGGDEAAKVVKTWLWDRLNVYVDFLGGLLKDQEKTLRISALQILFSLQKHLSTSYSKSTPSQPQFHNSHFRKIVSFLLLCPPSPRRHHTTSENTTIDPDVLHQFHETWFSVHDDVRWFFLRDAATLLNSTPYKIAPNLPHNLLAVLENLNTFPTDKTELNSWWVSEMGTKPPKPKRTSEKGAEGESSEDEEKSDDEEDDDDWRKFFDEEPSAKETKTQGPGARLHKLTIHQSLHSLPSHRAVFTRAWLAMLPRLSIVEGDGKVMAMRALNVMHRG
ncbi:hypothetical protein DXG01_004162, partial [Tephrocybe rancida]